MYIQLHYIGSFKTIPQTLVFHLISYDDTARSFRGLQNFCGRPVQPLSTHEADSPGTPNPQLTARTTRAAGTSKSGDFLVSALVLHHLLARKDRVAPCCSKIFTPFVYRFRSCTCNFPQTSFYHLPWDSFVVTFLVQPNDCYI